MREKHPIIIAFCEHSWKPFIREDEAIDFIKEEEEKYNMLWSITYGTIEFVMPYESKLGHKIQDTEIDRSLLNLHRDGY